MLTLVAPLAAAVLSAAVPPAAAQQAAVSDQARPEVRYAALAPAAAPRTLATLRFALPSVTGLPTRVTIADSSGVIVASYRLAGDRDPRPMVVTAFETDLVLQAETPSGVLTLHLYRANDPAARVVEGRWWLGSREGTLHGRSRR